MWTRKHWITRDDLPKGFDYGNFFKMSKVWRWDLKWCDNFVIKVDRHKPTRKGMWKR